MHKTITPMSIEADYILRYNEPQIGACPNCQSSITEDFDGYDIYECSNPDCGTQWEIRMVRK